MSAENREDNPIDISKDEKQFLSNFSTYMEASGLSATAGSIVGWLLICEPQYQSANQLKYVLGVAKSTISTTVRSLTAIGFIKKVRIHGLKGDYYQYNYDLANDSFKKRAEGLKPFINLYEQARDLNTPDSERRNKLDEMIEQSLYFQRKYAEMAGEWEEYRKKNYQK
jgi:DNA-binding transcriptional regulator GbsR (MarR family)